MGGDDRSESPVIAAVLAVSGLPLVNARGRSLPDVWATIGPQLDDQQARVFALVALSESLDRIGPWQTVCTAA